VIFGPGTYLVPREDGLVVVGATSEPEAGFEEGLTPQGQRTLQDGIASLLPQAMDWPPMERWWGFRPCTPDEGPLLGASPITGLWLACGHHRNGVLMAGLTAELVADAVHLGAPALIRRGPVAQLGSLEPETDLELGRFRGIGSMDHIATDIDRQITADGAGLGLQGLGRTNQFASAGDHTVALPDHRHHRAGRDELDQAGEEGALLMHSVVLLCQLPAGGELLEPHQLETLALETAKDLANETTLDAIGLDGNEGAFGSHE
jgi:hypothetical protein